jgi:hypothetical protein
VHATQGCIGLIRRAARLANPLAVGSLIGTRTECIRERAAPSRKDARTLESLYAEARIPKGTGPFSFLTSTGLRIGADPRSLDRTTDADGRRWTLFNNLLRDDLGTGRWLGSQICGCSSVGRARPRHGRGHEFETRHPLHFGCVLSLCCRVTWCWRCRMCATLGQATCSETPHPTGCSRLGTAEVDQSPS